jgi:hypothetical protein
MSQARNLVGIIKRNKKKNNQTNKCKNKQIELENSKKNDNHAHQHNRFCMKITANK